MLRLNLAWSPSMLDDLSQLVVIVNGEVRGQMKASEYFRTKRQLVPDILKAYDSLAEEADVIVIEGAGSPADDPASTGRARALLAALGLARTLGQLTPGPARCPGPGR